jgi:hypothetical protein
MSTLLPKGVQTKYLKNFLIEDFFHLPSVSPTLVVYLEPRYLREFSKKFEMAVMVYSGAWGKLIHEKNQKSKISLHCPFKLALQPGYNVDRLRAGCLCVEYS